jgi:hypothetical protein
MYRDPSQHAQRAEGTNEVNEPAIQFSQSEHGGDSGAKGNRGALNENAGCAMSCDPILTE